jgi:hypothetical protein
MNDPDALARISQTKLEVKRLAVLMQVEELCAVENGTPIAANKFVGDHLVPPFGRTYTRWLNANGPLNESARFFVLLRGGYFLDEVA